MWLSRAVSRAKNDHPVRVLSLEAEQTISCFCRKARRKEKEGNESSSTESKLYLETAVLERKLPDMDLRLLVDLPAGLDYNEWLASHTMALFDHVNLVYGSVSEFCTQSGCPDMTGPGQRTYLWFDEKGKKTKVAAPQYIDYVMTFIQKTISDETIFPTKYANEFPSSFESIVRKIVRLLFHVVAHLYAVHFKEVVMLGLHAHLNLTFAHLMALHHRFSLIEAKETDVLKDLEVALKLTDDVVTTELANNNEKVADRDVPGDSSSTDSKAHLNEENVCGAGCITCETKIHPLSLNNDMEIQWKPSFTVEAEYSCFVLIGTLQLLRINRK